MSDTDLELLASYTRQHTEDAFAEIVRRHLDLVHSAALRQVRSPQLAEEVAQATFIKLARQARQLAPNTILTAWLYQVARREAIDVVRREARRQLREQIATEMNAMNATTSDWTHIEPLLDEAMHALDDTDRAAVLLRYFENKSLREVGQTLGTSDDSAQKRVSRAIERQREFFAKRGVSVGASGLVVVISANAVQAAPVGLALTISTAAALAGTTLATTAIATATKAIAMTTLQKTLIAATLAVVAGTGIYEAHQASRLRDQVQTLQQQQRPLAGELAQLKTENERLSNLIAQTKDSQALPQAQLSELLKLRGNATVTQNDSRELAKLKTSLAKQTGAMQDLFTNAIASGLSTADKWKQKDALTRLARMKTTLHLTDDQERAISEIMMNHIQRVSQRMTDLMTGKLAPEQQQAQAGEIDTQEAEIKALFTPEQLAAYPEYQQTEKTIAADNSARSDSGQIADSFGLSKEQQEQLRSRLYEMNLNEPTNALNQLITQATRNGNFADAAQVSVELQKLQLDEKLKVLEKFLSPEQMQTYRQGQMDRINRLAEATKVFLLNKSAATPN